MCCQIQLVRQNATSHLNHLTSAAGQKIWKSYWSDEFKCSSTNRLQLTKRTRLFNLTQSTWEIPTLTQTATSNRSTANPTTPSRLLRCFFRYILCLHCHSTRQYRAIWMPTSAAWMKVPGERVHIPPGEAVPRRVPRSWKCEHRLVFTHDFIWFASIYDMS